MRTPFFFLGWEMMGFNSTTALDTLRRLYSTFQPCVPGGTGCELHHLKYPVITHTAIVYLYSNLAINRLFQVTWEATERKSEANDLDLGLIQLSKSKPLMEKGIPRSCAISVQS